jgi:hypothetical protein
VLFGKFISDVTREKMKKKPSKLKRIVRDPNGPFRMRVVSDKKKYTRKTKHKNGAL